MRRLLFFFFLSSCANRFDSVAALSLSLSRSLVGQVWWLSRRWCCCCCNRWWLLISLITQAKKGASKKWVYLFAPCFFFRLSDLVLFSALFFLRFTFPLWAWLCSCCCSCGCSGGGAVVVVVVVVVQGLLFSSVAAGSGWWVVELVVKFPLLITTQKKSLNSGQKPFSLRISL